MEEYSSWSKRRDSKSRRALTRREGSNPFSSAKKARHHLVPCFFGERGEGIRKIKSKLPVAAWSMPAGRHRNNYFRRSRKCKRIPFAPRRLTGGITHRDKGNSIHSDHQTQKKCRLRRLHLISQLTLTASPPGEARVLPHHCFFHNNDMQMVSWCFCFAFLRIEVRRRGHDRALRD